jgi:hypothetical protein
MICVFCDSTRELEKCTWPALQRAVAPVDLAVIGDTWLSLDGKRGRIMSIYAVEPEGPLRIGVRFPGSSAVYPYMRFRGTCFPTEAIGPCGHLVCPFHVRDLGGKFTCAAHWDAWREVA